MSILDQLWDDTVAGPPPDTGLGKLRKHHTFSSRGKETVNGSVDERIKVTRSIMIMKPQGTNYTESPPISPAGSSPISPFADLVKQERERHFGSGEGRYRTFMKRQMELDLGAHVLLTTCEI